MDSQDSNILLKMIRYLFSGHQLIHTGPHMFLKPFPLQDICPYILVLDDNCPRFTKGQHSL